MKKNQLKFDVLFLENLFTYVNKHTQKMSKLKFRDKDFARIFVSL